VGRYCALLAKWTPQSVAAASQSAIEFIYPLLQLFTLEIKQHMESSSQWKEDEVISLLEEQEAAFMLKGLD
jgi:hypothetical protein